MQHPEEDILRSDLATFCTRAHNAKDQETKRYWRDMSLETLLRWAAVTAVVGGPILYIESSTGG